tara:strand:- start:124 stop:339 length:216 start_codon:yes stop_codon:yes gene_type:complete
MNKPIAIILARGGSKSVPLKNIKPFGESNCLSLTINYLTFIDIAIKQAKRINSVSEILFSLESQEYNVLNY